MSGEPKQIISTNKHYSTNQKFGHAYLFKEFSFYLLYLNQFHEVITWKCFLLIGVSFQKLINGISYRLRDFSTL